MSLESESEKEMKNEIRKLTMDLQISTEKYERMLENLKEEFMFFCHDTRGNFTYMSPSVTNILGYSAEEYIGNNFEMEWTPNPVNRDADRHSRLSIQGIKQPPYEMEVYHKNGSHRRFITIETPVFNKSGDVIAVEGTARDVTEKKKTENKLRQYREHLEELVEQRTSELEYSRKQLFDIIDFLPIPTFVMDREGIIIAWNRAIGNMFGMEKSYVLGRDYKQCIIPFHEENEILPVVWILDKDGAVYNRKLSQKKSEMFVESYLEKLGNGEGVHAWVAASPIHDSENRIVGVIVTYRDVTDIKRAERQIRENERRLSAIMGNLPGMAYRIVKRGAWQVDFVSSGSRIIFDCEASFFIGKKVEEIESMVHPDDIARLKDSLKAAFVTRQPFHNEYRIIAQSGEIKWVFDRGEVIHDERSEDVTVEGFISDFTFYKEMEQRLRSENLLLRDSIKYRVKFGNIIGKSEPMQKVYEMIMKAASTDDPVSIYGESGTGKELVAKAIHDVSPRKDKQFVVVNCGAIPENLIESEFFGTIKGAFTGANCDKKGFLEIADEGTLFLDEIGEISLGFQVKLLRAIEGGGFTRVGDRALIKPDIRIICASNKDLFQLVRDGLMRRDFFFRIHVIPITLPPLRERGEDIFFLIEHFLLQYGKNDTHQHFSSEEIAMLRNYDWPGNIRELQNVLRRYVTFKKFIMLPSSGDKARSENSRENNAQLCGSSFVPDKIVNNVNLPLKAVMEDLEKNYIMEILQKNRWHRSATAKKLGISRKTLFRKLKSLGLNDSHYES